jgi:hypothetical protein
VKWRTNPLEGWHTGFALFPIALSSGDTIWLEQFRYYCASNGAITTIIGMPK